MTHRRVDGFFYGLFMDVDVLRRHDVFADNPRRAFLDGFALRLGDRATLVPARGERVYGMVLSLTHADLGSLYGAPGLAASTSRAARAQAGRRVAVDSLDHRRSPTGAQALESRPPTA